MLSLRTSSQTFDPSKVLLRLKDKDGVEQRVYNDIQDAVRRYLFPRGPFGAIS